MVRYGLLGLILFGLLASLIASPRPYSLTNRPAIEAVDAIPATADQAKLRRFLAYAAITLPNEADTGIARDQPPALGFSYREVSLFAMPFWAYPDFGFTLYDGSEQGVRMAPLDADYRKLLDKEAGRPLGTGYDFSILPHLWGWWLPLALLLWFVLQVRYERRKREESGII